MDNHVGFLPTPNLKVTANHWHHITLYIRLQFVEVGMALKPGEVATIAEEIARESLFKYFYGKKKITTEHILLKHIFPHDYKVRSAIGGLETSLGTRLWENLAKEIAGRNGFQIHDPKVSIMQPGNRIENVAKLMDQWNTNRNLPNNPIELNQFSIELDNLLANSLPVTHFKKLSKGDGVDIFLSKNSKFYAFDIKTVQWNAGAGPKFNTTLIRWITYHRLQMGLSNLNAYFVIPYDPTSNGWWHSFGSRAYPLDKNDILVGDEFWDLLSGESSTLSFIEDGFSRLATSSLMETYKNLLTQHSDDLVISLVEKTRGIVLEEKLPRGTMNRRRKWAWACKMCNTKFKSTMRTVEKNPNPCPNVSNH